MPQQNLPRRERNSYAMSQATGQVKAFASPWERDEYCFDHDGWVKVSGQCPAAQRLRIYRRRKQEREGAADMRSEAIQRHGAARNTPGTFQYQSGPA